MKTAIMTDTNSGILKKEAEELRIFSIPMPVIIEGETFFEGDNITEDAFYEALTGGKEISTSMPSPMDVLEMWESIFRQGYDQIVYVPMSSGLSTSCAAAAGLAKDYEGRVFVADNHRISIPLKEAVLEAKHMADSGASGSEIKAYLEKEAYNSSIYIAVDTLEYLKKGGRITAAAAAVGTVLNLKPILTIQGGKLDSFAKVRGMKKCLARMLDALQEDIEKRFSREKPENLVVGIAGTALSREYIEMCKNAVRERFPLAKTYYNPLSLSIGCHVGPGAAGVAVMSRKDGTAAD